MHTSVLVAVEGSSVKRRVVNDQLVSRMNATAWQKTTQCFHAAIATSGACMPEQYHLITSTISSICSFT